MDGVSWKASNSLNVSRFIGCRRRCVSQERPLKVAFLIRLCVTLNQHYVKGKLFAVGDGATLRKPKQMDYLAQQRFNGNYLTIFFRRVELSSYGFFRKQATFNLLCLTKHVPYVWQTIPDFPLKIFTYQLLLCHQLILITLLKITICNLIISEILALYQM